MHLQLNSALAALILLAEAKPTQKRGWQNPIRNDAFPLDIVDQLQDSIMPKAEAYQMKKNQAGQAKCTMENALVRREWSDLSVAERIEYTDAVRCLMKKPARAPKDLIPGAISRFDDFVGYHMTQAYALHDTTTLLASHRYYIWAYEKALRDECGYTGAQPYMNYERYKEDPIHSAMFNGNASSMGGNGAPHTYGGVQLRGFTPALIPPAGGGGCVTEGPFKDMVVSLGPKGKVLNDLPVNPHPEALGSNPRCLRRDVNRESAQGAGANYSYSLIMDNPTIDGFYNRYLGLPYLENDNHPWGMHISGHYIIGGDPGGDFFASPGDPAFYFHHGSLDRLWWIWQMQDPEQRTQLIPGERAVPMFPDNRMPHDLPDSGDEIVDMEWLAGPAKIRDINDNMGGLNGEMCYYYV